jgi:hypothetical protein
MAVEAQGDGVICVVRTALFLRNDVVDFDLNTFVAMAHATMAGCFHQGVSADGRAKRHLVSHASDKETSGVGVSLQTC